MVMCYLFNVPNDLYAVPGAVTGFNVVNRTASEMFVIWNQPLVTNGVLTGYQLTLTGI